FPHAVERAQLVTILTLGETVIAIISTYPLTESLYQGALLFAGMSFMFISYMTQTFLAIDHHRQAAGSLLFYAHIPIFIGINIFT
ncbi:low temperature requirement protein A, partial [Enterococcus gallinarum]